MRITVLGAAASYPGPGQACQGHLVSTGHTDVLLDCGNGVIGNLGRLIDPLSVDAVFVTHRHPDHFLDLYALQGAIRYAPQGPAEPIDLYAPPGLFERLLLIHEGGGAQDMREAFREHVLVAASTILVGDLLVTPVPVTHMEDSFGLRVAGPGGTIFYTSDTRYGEQVLAGAMGCDVLVAEATMPEAYAGRAPHMSAKEAGRLASEAGAKTLMLTHLWPTTPRSEILGDASETFSGEIVLAEELRSVQLRDEERDDEPLDASLWPAERSDGGQ